jgi:N-acetylglucosaminyldiphosphoundecaprenol N-acetyl-beta-D-mannosaminyltransferase
MRRKPNQNKKIGYFVDASTLNKAFHDDTLRLRINTADYVLPDGSGITMAARSKGLQVKDSIDRASIFELLIKAATKQKKSIYFLGGAPGVAWTAVKRLKERYPKLIVAGCHHGCLNDQTTAEVIGDINDSGSAIMLVGMGTPMQENWIDQYKGQLETETMLGVGWLLDLYAGLPPQVPPLFRSMGLDWLWFIARAWQTKLKRDFLDKPLLVLRATLDPEQ